MTNKLGSLVVVVMWSVLGPVVTASGSDPYDVLLSNPRVTAAIETNPFIAPGSYLDFLRMKIDQLEIGQTESWDDYRHPSPHTDQEIAEVILQKVALSLYVEVNELVPWSLLDYDDDSLRIVLGDAYTEISSSPFWDLRILFNLNPLLPFAYAKNLRVLYPDHPINSAKDLLDLTIIKMRDDNWVHVANGFSTPEACAGIGYLGFVDFECAALTRKGTSAQTPLFIYSVLHAQNIPSRDLLWFGHGGIEFPSLGIGMDGDGVYNSLESGFMLHPNFLPVDISYLELSLFDKWSVFEFCEGRYFPSRRNALQYLELLYDPTWNADILAAYCFRLPGYYPLPGDFLLWRGMIDGQLASRFCQDDDPEGEDYQAPALTEEEIVEWSAAIAELATDCAACSVDSDCDDGDFCNGAEYCDEFGFCDVGLPPDCDDGLLCTYNRCVDGTCVNPTAVYGDVNGDEIVDLMDVLCVLDGFAGQFYPCSRESLDIGDCTPDGKIDLSDILAVLDGFQGLDPCCGN